MDKKYFYIVNALTLYRLVTAPLLIFLVFNDRADIFKWLLAASFLTDALDGYLSRRFKVTSIAGSKLDSIADQLTVFASLTGIIFLRPEFLKQHVVLLALLFVLYLLKIILSLIRYGKISGFHTYAAKVAAILQGVFLILFFFLPEPVYPLFYLTLLVTAIDLAEEIVLVFLLPQWEANVKGLFWVLRKKDNTPS